MTIPSHRINTPYVYMTKEGQDGNASYTLYIYIAIYQGTTVSSPTEILPIISFTINGTATSTNIIPKYFRINLAAPSPPANPLDTPDLTIEVKKSRIQQNLYMPPTGDMDPDKYGNRETTILYRDADNQASIQGNVAFNCPYAYLTNPYAVIGLDIVDFAGRCHVPIQGCDYSPGQQTFMVNSPQAGSASLANCEQEVKIFPFAAAIKTEVSPTDIDCNQKEYKDGVRQVGFYEIIVTHPPAAAAPPVRKTTLRNRSSDTHPNGFIG